MEITQQIKDKPETGNIHMTVINDNEYVGDQRKQRDCLSLNAPFPLK